MNRQNTAQRDRAIMLGLAALYQLTEQVGAEPLDRPLWLRALLSTLHALSNGDRRPYEDFWKVCHMPRRKDQVDSVEQHFRATYARTHWTSMVRTFGFEPQAMTFHDAIRKLIAQADVGPAAMAERLAMPCRTK